MTNIFDPLNPFRGGLAAAAVPIKRKAFFSFHFDDVMRVNNVRNAWKIDHPDNGLMRSFYDSSLWESRKLEGDEAVKRLIREGVENTSACCVLIGTETWSRRWVHYEIARSVVDGRGLVGVHLNNLNHHQRRVPDPLGFNPLEMLGIFNSGSGKYYIYKKTYVMVNHLTGQGEWQWHPYGDYTLPVSLPKYLWTPDVGYVVALAYGTQVYDFVVHEGHKNLGAWIDASARQVGR